MNSQKTTTVRSWTASEETGSGKWLPVSLLTVLLVIGLFLFIYYVRWTDAPRTFAIAISIPEYNEALLPQPAYPEWELNGVVSAFSDQGLVPWVAVENRKLSTRKEISDVPGSLAKEFKGLSKQDTVVVYLRGHAINHRGQAFLLAGEFDRKELLRQPEGEVTELPGAIAFSDLLESLQGLKAGNIVLLADICDLPTVPRLGVVANNVPELIEKSVANLATEKPLWVITSAASMQATHASDLRRRTLLQSASEYACNSRLTENAEQFLSLAKLYEAMLRYSDQVTEGRQTPLLFRSGSKGPLVDSRSKAWGEANSVSIARKESASKVVPPVIADAVKPKEEVAVANAKPEEKKTEAPDASENQEVVEQSPWLRYWQVHDQLLDRRRNEAGWSPVDFAAENWRTSVVKATQLERLHRLGVTKTDGEMKALIGELDDLEKAFQSGSVAAGTTGRLLTAWRKFDLEITPESGKHPWKAPNDLPSDQKDKWLQIRQSYRTYFDAMGQLSGWLDALLRERDDRSRKELSELVPQLVNALAALESELPKAGESALEKPLTAAKIAQLESVLTGLKNQRAQQVTSTVEKIVSAKAASKRINWSLEREVQQLLEDTHLTYRDRKRLVDSYAAIDVEQLDEPGTANNDTDKNKELRSLLTSDAEGTLSHYASWCSVMGQAVALVNPTKIGKPLSTSESLNEWGQKLLASTLSTATNDPTLRWKRSCLNDLKLFADNEGVFEAGLIVTVSNDTTVDVRVPSRIRLPNSLECIVMKRNGTKISNCWLQWEVRPPPNFKGRLDGLLAVKLRGDKLEPATLHSVQVMGGKVDLTLETKMSQSELAQGLNVRVGIGNEESTEKLNWHDVLVMLPNPDRIDLYAKCVNPGDVDQYIDSSQQEFGPVLRDFRVPAVEGKAKSQYEFYLANRSDIDKTVRASVYYVESSQTVGNGTIFPAATTLTKRELANLKKCFESKAPVWLPKSDQDISGKGVRTNGQRLELVPVVHAADDQSAIAATGEFGLLCVLEEVALNEDKSARSLNKFSEHWIECVPVNPYGELVKIVPKPVVGAFEFQFTFLNRNNWARWGLKELKIDAELTDEDGVPISNPASSVVLTPENSEATITIRPNQLPSTNKKLVAHFDIGGYPRAFAFDSRLKGEPEETKEASQAFAWLDSSGIDCTSKDGKHVPTQAIRTGENVVPAREGVNDTSEGTAITITTLSVPFRIDFPSSNLSGLRTKAKLSLNNDGPKLEYEFDRRFRPVFEATAGNLVFSARVEDLRGEFQIANAKFDGKVKVEVSVVDSSGEVQAFSDLIFDRRPPLRAAVVVEPTELYLEEGVVISIDATDAESEVNQVFFAIDREGFKEGRFDEKDLLHLKAEPIGGRWKVKLEATDALNAKLIPGPYSIVCRSIDIAGNFQDENIPARGFHWTGKKRPVIQPPTETKKKEPVKVELPKEFNVTIQVTVDGKAPSIPKNVAVNGIPGTEINNNGIMIYTKVPEGAYDVTASYTDSFGGQYLATKKITVNAGSSKFVMIDVKNAK